MTRRENPLETWRTLVDLFPAAESARNFKATKKALIRECFHTFLFTYEVRADRALCSISSEERNALDEVALELRYGEANYHDRKERLDYVLDELFAADRVHFGAALGALCEAKGLARVSAHDTKQLDAFRELHEEGDLVRKNLLQWTTRLRGLCSRSPLVDSADLKRINTAINELLLTEKEIVGSQVDESSPFYGIPTLKGGSYEDIALVNHTTPRRTRRGAPPRPWLKSVKRKLRDAGVPPEFRAELLISLGLLPYRPLDT